MTHKRLSRVVLSSVVLGAIALFAQSTRSGDAKSTIYLAGPKRIDTRFQGPDATVRALNAGQARPLALASGDFDADGTADLAAGYATADGGRIGLFRGNLDAFAPQSQASFEAIGKGNFPAPFLTPAGVVAVPGQPDFLVAGEFIGHSGPGLVAATRGGHSIYVLAWGVSGSFELQQTIDVPGAISALSSNQPIAGQHSQVVAGVRGDSGPALFLYSGSEQGLTAAASFPLAADATAFAFGNLDGDNTPDVLAVVGGQLAILHAGTRTLQEVKVPFTVASVAVGNFVSDRDPLQQMALLSTEGTVHVFAQDAIDSRPFSLEEMQARRRAQIQMSQRGRALPARPTVERRVVWTELENFPGAGTFEAGNQAPQFFRTRITGNGADDIMLLGSGRLTVIAHPGDNPTTGVVLSRTENLSSIAAALPQRINIDGRPGVVLLKQDGIAPWAMMPLPDPTFFVNRTDDPVPGAIGSTCNNVSNVDVSTSCSLREAVRKANATAGTDTIMVAAGTYTLTQPRAVSPAYDAVTGTLDVTDSVNIVGAVDGGGNPTSIIQAGTTSANGVDKIFSFNQDIVAFTNASVSISNLVLKFGRNRGDALTNQDGFGGAFDFDTGGTATATLTITNCNITNNQTTDGEGGGFEIFNTNAGTGSATITNSIVQNNNTLRNPANGDPNAAGNGGGITVAFPAKLTMTNTQVLNNTATQTQGTGKGIGGGLFVIGGGGVTNSITIHGGAISGNQAALDGGGLWSTAGLTIDQGTIISNNTAAGSGGGIWFNGDAGDPASLTKVTITGNTATAGTGGGIQVDAAGQPLSITFSRMAANTAGGGGKNLANQAGAPGSAVTATNDWWGTNTPATTITGTVTSDPFIVLTNTASPNKIRINQSTTLTGDMSKDNHGNGAALAGNLNVIVGLPITFNNPVLGTIPQAQPETLNASAQATATYNAGGVGGNGAADAIVDQQTVTAPIIVLQPPSITKAFNPTTVAVNAPSTITFSVTNGNTVAINGSFTDTLPANLVVANTPSVTNNCGGSVTAVAGAGTISFTNAASLAVGTCTILVNVQGTVDGVFNNSVTINSTDAGNGNTANASLTVINPPTIVKAFGAATIPLNGTTSLTFTLSSTNANLTLNGVAFTDTMPAGLVVATPNNLSSTCTGATATAVAGSGSVSLAGATLAPAASCTVSVNVTGTTPGVKNNSVQPTSTNGGNGTTSNASITVVGPPVIIKAFGAASIPLNGSTSLTFTIQNNNTTSSLTGVGFSDTLPTGLVISTPNGLTGSCGGGTITATQSTIVISLSGATLAQSTSCTFSVNVTGAAPGPQNNTTGNVTSTEGGTGGTASASVNVIAPPAIVKAFGAANVPLNGTTSLTFTISNPAANTVAETGVAFADTLPAGLVVATPNGLTNTCGGTATAVAGSGSISLTGGTIAVNASCTLTVNVTATTTGVKNNTSGAVSSTNGGTGNTASASVTVAQPPTITKAFGAAAIPLNGTTSLTFNITNPNAAIALTGVAFTDNLPAGLVVATPNGLTNTCGGTATAVAGAGSVSLSAGTLATSGTCSVAVNVQGTTAGVKNNSVQVTSTEGGTGNTSNASVTVAAPPVIIKAFGAASIPLSGSTSLTFTIQNNNTTTTLTGVGFSDTLPAGLVVSTPNGLTGSCGGGTITATQATNVISLTGATLAQSTSCTFAVNVTGTAAGTQNNTTGNVTSTEGGTGGTASASINVVAPPSIAKAFGGANVPLNGTTSLTFTITNPAADAVAETGVAFTDTLPAGLVVATPNGLTNTCGGTATAVAGSGSISLTGGTIAVNSACTLVVNVTATTTGVKNNTSGNVTSTNGGTGNTASASITVAQPPTITKAFGAAAIPLGGSTSLTFTIQNPNGAITLNGIAFTDTLPAGLVVATPSGVANICGGATTAVSGAGSVSLAAGTLAASASCTVSVNITGTTAGIKNNSVQVTSTEGGTGNTSNASITVTAPPVIIKAFGAASIPLNGSTSLTFTIQNNNTTTTLTGVGFSDTLPAGLVVSTPNGLTGSCGSGTITATQATNVISLTGATLAQSTSCTFAVNVTGTAAGTQNNTTGNVTSTEGGTGGTASASINVVAPPSIAKAFGAPGVPINGTTSLTFTITNPAANAVAETGVAFTDTLPAGLVVATPNGLANTCGGTATAVAGSGSISLTGGTIAASSACTLVVNVTGTTGGVKNNTSGNVTSTNGGTGNTASASITVAAPPTITKAFGAAAIPLNGTTSLTFNITNPNANVTLTGIAFTDNLPAGLVVATPNALASTCGGTATAVSGAGSLSLAAGTLAASANCTVSVNIQGTTPGVKNNSVQVTSTEGGAGNTSNASITVTAPPVIIKAFGAASIPLNGSTSLTFTIQNNNTTTTLTGVGFSDTLPAGLVISTPNGLTGSCGGGTITATAATNVISLTGSTLAASTSCTFSVNVTGTAAGTQNNTTGNVTSTEGGTGGTASASISVVGPPSVAKAFAPTGISLGATSTLTFTLTNPASNVVALTGVAFTDVLPVGLVVSGASGLTDSCGGVATAAGTSISLTGGTITAGSPCALTVSITGTAAGVFVNTSGAVSSTNGGTGNTATATLTVAQPPAITKAFGAATIPLNGVTSLTFTIQNSNASVVLNGIAFTDNLPAGLVVAPAPNLNNTCGGTATAAAGTSVITLTAGTLAASSNCAVSLSVQGTTAGVKNNSTSVTSTTGGPGNTSNASITVVAPPVIIKAFGAASIPLSGSTSLTFTIQNNNTTVALTGVAFTDALPAGLVVSTPNGLTGTCGGGTITATAGAGAISLSGATIAPSAACTFAVNVTAVGGGVQNNTTGNVTSNEGGPGGTASASITVLVADLTITKTHAGNFRQGQTGATYTITVTNNGAAPTFGTVSVVDALPSGLVATALAGTNWNCIVATLTCTRADALPVGNSYPPITLTVNVTANAPPLVTNSVTVSGGGEANTGNDTATDPTTVIQVADMTITKSHSGVFAHGQIGATYTLSVSNVGLGATLGAVGVADALPAGLTATAISGTNWVCTLGTLSCTRSDVLAPGGSYEIITVTVNVSFTAAPLVTNSATVSGGGELNTANDTATDPTTIAAGPPATITATSGTPQTVPILTAYGPLVATVRDAGGTPVPGAAVTFASTGGVVFSDGTLSSIASTNAQGNATPLTVIAAGSPGSYTVLATVGGVADSALFRLNASNAGGGGGGGGGGNPGPSIGANPRSLNFTFDPANPSTPSSQVVQITSNPLTTVTATSTAPWLSLSGGAASAAELRSSAGLGSAALAPLLATSVQLATPASLTVSVSPAGLSAGRYYGQVVLSAPGVTAYLFVELDVNGPSTLSAAPTSASFSVISGQAAPPTQTIQLNTTGFPVSFTLAASAPWIKVTANQLSTPSLLTLGVDPTGLAPGQYTGSVQMTSAGATNSPFSIPVTLTVASQLSIKSGGIVNDASFVPGPGAPNTIMALFGNVACASGPGVQINNAPAEVLSANSTQINFTLPGSISGLNSAQVQVNCGALQSSPATLPLAPVAPAIFTLPQTGTGQGAILNQDSSVNGAANAAGRGTVLAVYGTGFGTYAATSSDGLTRLSQTVTAFVGEVSAQVQFSGRAPGYTTGLQQINILIPAGAPSGASVPIRLTVGGSSTQPGVTVAIQ